VQYGLLWLTLQEKAGILEAVEIKGRGSSFNRLKSSLHLFLLQFKNYTLLAILYFLFNSSSIDAMSISA